MTQNKMTQNKKIQNKKIQNYGFQHFGTMLDCSRNAVMNVKSIKKWIDITCDLGYNTLLLYTEDTYEVDENPYFGYMRGRYSQEELMEIDQYASERGMELIPCIQTLAHLNAIVRWPAYAEHVDTDDILLAGDEAVYQLIDQMFAAISRCFTSRTVNIGMDEAHMIGRGKYYDQHGDHNRYEILLEHLKKVSDIGRKYGFTLIMWSDMFFRIAGGDYYNSEAEINHSVREEIPDNVKLVYWDYYSTQKEHYDRMLAAHKNLKEDTWFAGGLWSWTGMAPHNGFSMNAADAALKSCRENGITNVIMTLWGDNGGECSKFALLPALFYASEIAKGNTDREEIQKKFMENYGISFEDFMLLDLPGTPGVSADQICNADKYLFYNDCFTGLMNSTLTGDENEEYALCAKKLEQTEKKEPWGYLFETGQALCEFLSIKACLGIKTREVYTSWKQERTKTVNAENVSQKYAEDLNMENQVQETLRSLISDYQMAVEKLEIFYKKYKTQWFTENKPHGFDVQDIRIGGLLTRIRSCQERLQHLYDGEIDVIEELEEQPLDLAGNGKQFTRKPMNFNDWSRTVTANVIA